MASKTYKNTATILTGNTLYIDPLGRYGGTKDYMKKFAPFNSLFVSNEDTNTIEIYPNGNADRKQVIPQGGTRNLLTMDGSVDVFEYVIVKNIGSGTVAANNVIIRIGREGK